MKKVVLILFMLGVFSIVNSQVEKVKELTKMENGTLIIENSRKKIGIDKFSSNLTAIKFSTSKTLSSEKVNSKNKTELNILLPDKIQSVYMTETPFESKSISLWNGEKFKKTSEITMPDGKKIVRDMTNENAVDMSKFKIFEGKIEKEKLEQLKKISSMKKPDPKEVLNNQIWYDVFPIVLLHPFEQNLEFQYVGKAESNGKKASVVDVKSKNERTYRLLFDEETSLLLMMIENHKEFVGDVEREYERKFYYSEHKQMGSVYIPTKIKIEIKSFAKGEEPFIAYENITVNNLEINPEFKKDAFKVD